MPQNCYRCGAESGDDAIYCSKCAARLRRIPKDIKVRTLIVGAALMLVGFLSGTILAVHILADYYDPEGAIAVLSLCVWAFVVPGLIVSIVGLAKSLRP
jgi:ribosomal protein L40E